MDITTLIGKTIKDIQLKDASVIITTEDGPQTLSADSGVEINGSFLNKGTQQASIEDAKDAVIESISVEQWPAADPVEGQAEIKSNATLEIAGSGVVFHVYLERTGKKQKDIKVSIVE